MRKTIAFLFAATLAGGCDLEAEAEADTVCVQQAFPGRTVRGVGVGTTTPVTIPLAFQVDIGAALPSDLGENGVEADANARSIAIRSTTPGTDFSGITAAELKLVAPGKPDVVFRYQNPSGGAASEVRATPVTPVDLVDYIDGGRSVTIRDVTLSGRPPATDWAPALETCAETKITVDYLDAAGL